jgi:hypothetical protein
MLVAQALAAQIVDAIVPASSTPAQRGVAMASWIKISTALVSYFQANTTIIVPGQAAAVVTAGSPSAQSGVATVVPTTVSGIL